MHVAKADVLRAGVDLQRHPLLLWCADQDARADGDDRLLPRIAAFGAFGARRTYRADVLPLMAKAIGALAHAEIAGLAKAIPPWIDVVSFRKQVQRLAGFAIAE